VRDAEGTTTLKRFKIDQLPAFIILDKDGKPVAEPIGGLTFSPTPEDENDLVNQIARRIDQIL
jgi:hypothetical protein